MLAALLASALAAPLVEPLLVDGGAIADAEFLPLPGGETAIVVHPARPDGGAVVLLPEEAAWRAVRIPAGAVVAGEDGLHAVVAWPHPLLAGRHWWLDGQTLVRQPDLPTPPEAHGLLAVSAEGTAVTAWSTTGGVMERRQARGGSWTRRVVPGATAFDDEGTVWVEDAKAMRSGGRRHAAPPRPEGGTRTFDESPGGDAAFLTHEPGRIRTWWQGAVHDHPVPETRLPDPAQCLKRACPARYAAHILPRNGRLAFDAGNRSAPLFSSMRLTA